MIDTQAKVGDPFVGYYPTGGTSNVLSFIEGTHEKFGIGPNGPYRTVHKLDGTYRTLSDDKIVKRLN